MENDEIKEMILSSTITILKTLDKIARQNQVSEYEDPVGACRTVEGLEGERALLEERQREKAREKKRAKIKNEIKELQKMGGTWLP